MTKGCGKEWVENSKNRKVSQQALTIKKFKCGKTRYGKLVLCPECKKQETDFHPDVMIETLSDKMVGYHISIEDVRKFIAKMLKIGIKKGAVYYDDIVKHAGEGLI